MSTSSTDSTYPSICFSLLRISHNAVSILVPATPIQRGQSEASLLLSSWPTVRGTSRLPRRSKPHAPARLVMLFLDAEYALMGAHRLLGSDYAASSPSLQLSPLDGHAYPTQVISMHGSRNPTMHHLIYSP